MSFHQFLKTLNSVHIESSQKLEEEQGESNLFGGFSFGVVFSFCIGSCLILFVTCCMRKKAAIEQKPSIILNFVFNLQNYFNNPTISDVHFYNTDQVVPNSA